MAWVTSRSDGRRAPASPLADRSSSSATHERQVGEPVSPPTVVLVGTLDTKGKEYAFLRERL
jgi:hypothetical protein